MEAFTTSMLDRLLMTSLQATVLAAVAWLLCRPALRLSPATQCWLWWLVALSALLGLCVDPVRLPWLPAAPVPTATAALSLDEALPATGGMTMAAVGGVPSTWQAGLLLLWAAGVAVMLVATLRGWRRAQGVLERSASADARSLLAIAAASRECGLRSVPRLRISPDIASPMLIGPLRPVLLLPASAVLSSEELGMAVAHELAHLRRADLWWGLLPALARHCFFFHPLVHAAVREYGIAREAACDAAVVQAGEHTRHQYGELLLRLGTASSSDAGLAAASPTFRSLSRRLVLLQEARFAPRAGIAVLLLFAVAGVLPLRLVAAAGEAPAAVVTAAAPVQPLPSMQPMPANAAPAPAPMRANARVKQSSSGNAGAPPPARPVRVAAVIPADTRVTYAFRPDPADYYPAASMAAGEQGIALVRLCYDEIGKVVESTLAEGSGFPRLDEAAVRMGKQFRFKPAMAGGVPRPDCVVVPVRFSTQPDAASARYSGPNMSGSFTAIDVPTLLGIIAQSSGRRIVVDPSVTGTITLRATDVPWEQLLDIVVQTKGLEKRVTDNEIVIAAKERAAR